MKSVLELQMEQKTWIRKITESLKLLRLKLVSIGGETEQRVLEKVTEILQKKTTEITRTIEIDLTQQIENRIKEVQIMIADIIEKERKARESDDKDTLERSDTQLKEVHKILEVLQQSVEEQSKHREEVHEEVEELRKEMQSITEKISSHVVE